MRDSRKPSPLSGRPNSLECKRAFGASLLCEQSPASEPSSWSAQLDRPGGSAQDPCIAGVPAAGNGEGQRRPAAPTDSSARKSASSPLLERPGNTSALQSLQSEALSSALIERNSSASPGTEGLLTSFESGETLLLKNFQRACPGMRCGAFAPKKGPPRSHNLEMPSARLN